MTNEMRDANGSNDKMPRPQQGAPSQGSGMAEPQTAKDMPTGGMPESKPGSEVSGGMDGAASGGAEMPKGQMRESAPGSPMPLGGGAPARLETFRFRPDGQAAEGIPPPQWQPGIIEVEFRNNVKPEVLAAAGSPAGIRSPAGASVTAFNQILQLHGVEKVEPSFDTPSHEADRIQADALKKGTELPHLGNFLTVRFPKDADLPAIAAELARLPEIERAVPVPQAIPPGTPLNEPLVGVRDTVILDPSTGLENQWYLHRCGIQNAWARSSGAGVVIADIDWGYRTSHQDLAPRLDLTRAYNSFDGGSNVSHGASTSHGTAVLGIAGGADNDLGMAGIAYEATLWPIQANSGPGSSLGGEPWARAIEWVRTADSGGRRKVIILEVQTGSFGNYEMVPSVNVAIRTAIADGVIVCVAAGNGNRDAGTDDAGNAIPDTGSILVGATEYHATQNPRAWFSNFNPRVVVCAPGDSSHDLTCSNTGDAAYRNGFGGTSGATPKVAGTVALMLSANPTLTHAEIRTLLRDTGTSVVTDSGKPVGTFLNAEAAVRGAQRNATGRMEVFVRGSDGALWHKWQVAPNSGWSGWASQGGWIDLLAVDRNADGRMEVFARGSDRALWHKWQVAPNSGWSGWASLGGWIDILSVAHNADGRMEVFVRGSDGAIWHKWQTAPSNGWSGWESLGGWVDLIEIGQNLDGRLEIFARGSDGALWHKWQVVPNGGWSGWASLGGWIDRLALSRNADGRMEIFARGSDGALWHKWQVAPNSGWSGWASLGGWIDSLAVGQNADGRMEVFARGSDCALWHIYQTAPSNGWSGWESLGGWIDRVNISRNADGRMEVFVRGSDGALWHKWQVAPNSGWSGWNSLGGWIDILEIGQNARG